ncbi:hypothetical protein KKB18_05955 [bacterium]|nr:hypothetical protein [bacterium]
MENKKFSIGEAMRFGWDTFKTNVGFFIAVMVIFALILAAFVFVEKHIDSGFLRFIVSLIRFVVTTLLSLGLVKISLKFYDKQKAEIGDLFSCTSVLVSGVIASFLYSVGVGIGLILLIVPGVFIGIMFQFFGYFIVEKNMSPIDALKQSNLLTTGIKMDLFLFDLILVVLNIVGVICLGVGAFITGPVSMLAHAYVYRKLTTKEEISQKTEISPEKSDLGTEKV